MASWLDSDAILYRGSPTTDPMAVGSAPVLLPLIGATPSDPIYGGPTQTAGKRLDSVIDSRPSILITHPPFTVEPNKYPDFCDYGRWWYFEHAVSKFPHLFIMALYLVGSDPDAGPPPRAWYDPVTDTTTDEFWISGNAFTYPLEVVSSAQFNAQPSHEIGCTTVQPYTLLVAEV